MKLRVKKELYWFFKNSNKFFILFIIISHFICIPTFSQTGYVSTDTTLSTGLKLINGTNRINSKVCRVEVNNGIMEYTPYQISEYGFKNGSVYVSREIKTTDSKKRIFLERLYNELISLYYLNDNGVITYFVEKDSLVLTAIPKKNKDGKKFNEQLAEITNDCNAVIEASKHVNYNKKSLIKFFKRYNSCIKRSFPHFRYGVIFGYELMKLNPSKSIIPDDIRNLDYNYDGSFSLGIFIDNPLFVSDFSVHSEAVFSKHGFSYNKIDDEKDLDFVSNITSLEIPLLLRYAYPSNKFRPFLNIGTSGTFNLRNETLVTTSLIDGNVVELNNAKSTNLMNDIQFGFCFGGGIEYYINHKYSIFLETRYVNKNGFYSRKNLGVSNIELSIGLYFN